MSFFANSRWETWMAFLSLAFQITAILVACAGLTLALRRRSAALAHQVWSLGLASILLLPTILLLAKPWTIVVGQPPVASVAQTGGSMPIENFRLEEPADSVPMAVRDSNHKQAFAPTNEAFAPQANTHGESRQQESTSTANLKAWLPQDLLSWLTSLWIAGAIVMAMRLAAAVYSLYCAFRGSRIADDRMQKIAQSLLKKLRLERSFELRVAVNHRMPVAFWLGKWIVVLPSTAIQWDDELLQSVIAHELGHVVRRDALTDFLAQLACAAYWFHPMVWFATGEARRLREQACDDLVLRQAQLAPTIYARHLLDVVSECLRSNNRLASAIASSNNVESRIRRILNHSLSRVPNALFHRGVLCSMMLLAIAMSMIQLTLAAAEKGSMATEHVLSAAGQVVDKSGKPYADATVRLRAVPSMFYSFVATKGHTDLLATTKTDLSGNFEFKQVAIPHPFGEAWFINDRQHRFELLVTTPTYGLTHFPLFERDSKSLKIELRPRGTVKGVVVDTRGNPVADAVIEVATIDYTMKERDPFARKPGYANFMYSSQTPTVKTDSEGRFEFDDLPDRSRLALWTRHEQHPFAYTSVEVGEDAKPHTYKSKNGTQISVQANPVKIELGDGYLAELKLAGHDGKPVDAVVRMRGQSDEVRMLPSNGLYYRAALSEPGDCFIDIRTKPASGNQFQTSTRLTLREENKKVAAVANVVLPAMRTISGRVVSNLGNPAARVNIQWSPKIGAKPVYSSSATTDNDGNYRIAVVAGEGEFSYRRNTSAPANGIFVPTNRPPDEPLQAFETHPAFSIVVPDSDGFVARDLVFPSGLVVSGTVRDSLGVPVPDEEITAHTSDRYGPRTGTATTNEQGQYSIAGLNPHSSYQLTLTTNSQVGVANVEKSESHDVTKTRAVTKDITTAPTVVVFGQVFLGETPYAGMPITLKAGREVERGTSYKPVSSTKTDEEGRYRLPGLLPGDKYRVEINPPFPAISPGWRHQNPFVVSLPDEAKDEYELDVMKLVRMDQELSGQIIDPDGNPVAGASVSADMADGRMLARFKDYPPPWTNSDEDGRFQLTHLPKEPIRLMAYIRPKSGNRIEFPAHMTPELDEQDIKIVLDPSLHEE